MINIFTNANNRSLTRAQQETLQFVSVVRSTGKENNEIEGRLIFLLNKYKAK